MLFFSSRVSDTSEYDAATARTYTAQTRDLVGAVVFNRDLVQRLLLLQENTRKIALGEGLPPPMPGHDEIARADRAIHHMAQALQESARKEEILFHNVKAVLASLDRHGRIREINDTIREVLGFTPARTGEHRSSYLHCLSSVAIGMSLINKPR